MALLVSCPNCRLEGQLPDNNPGGLIGCPRCGSRFPPPAAEPPLSLPSSVPDGFSVWVGPESPPTVTPPPVRNLAALGRRGEGPSQTAASPVAVTAENAALHLDWLRSETARFRGFVDAQLDALRKKREEIAALESRVSGALVTREMELSREKVDLAARAAALDRRDAELALERSALSRRTDEVERMEQAVQRRLAEVDELEQALRNELEGRAREVELQRREVDAALRELRTLRDQTAAPSNNPNDLLSAWHCG